jgi:hypothetical protein
MFCCSARKSLDAQQTPAHFDVAAHTGSPERAEDFRAGRFNLLR